MSAHRHLNILLSLFLALAALLLLLLSIAGAAGITADETALNPDGLAAELNLDSQGTLWVSDYGAGEIRSFDTTSGAYTAYKVGGGPSDARSDGAGTVWWADYDNQRLGRLSTSTNQTTTWEIPNSIILYSTAIDSSGDVWVSDYSELAPFIYRLDPDSNQLCTYALPYFGVSDYLYTNGQQLWFGDVRNARLVRLQNDTFGWWDLPQGSYPQDLELDGNGQLWWTDPKKGYVGRLDGDAATITTFRPPASGEPQMLTLSGGKVWYSQQDPSRVVVLDPALATSETMTVITGTLAATSTCSSDLNPVGPIDITASSGQAKWTGQIYRATLDEAGWTIYAMPDDSAPWGISATDKIWLVDQDRKVLARLGGPSSETYLPLVLKR